MPINILTASQLIPPDLLETQQEPPKPSSRNLYSTHKSSSPKASLSYNKTPSPTSSIKPVPIYLILYTKTCYEGKEIDMEQLLLIVDIKQDINLVWLTKTPKDMAQIYADNLGLVCQLVSAIYVITWGNIKKEEKLA